MPPYSSSGSGSVNDLELRALIAAKQDTISFDDVPTHGSSNPVTSHGIKAADLGVHGFLDASKQDTLTFDNTPTAGSDNPVTSDGILSKVLESYMSMLTINQQTRHDLYGELAQKQDTLTFDTVPTAGSTKPVTSGGVATITDALGGGVNSLFGIMSTLSNESISNTSTANQSVNRLSMIDANMAFRGDTNVPTHNHNHRGIWPADVTPNVDDNFFFKVEEINKVSGNNRLVFNSNGQTSYRMGFQVVKDGNKNEAIRIQTSGRVDIMTGITSPTPLVISSDDRLKNNESPIQNALQTIRKVRPTLYTKVQKEGDTHGAIEAGVIAQELETISELAFCVHRPPEEVDEETGETNYMSVAYNPLLIHALAALQELDAIVQSQAATMAALAARILVLEQTN